MLISWVALPFSLAYLLGTVQGQCTVKPVTPTPCSPVGSACQVPFAGGGTLDASCGPDGTCGGPGATCSYNPDETGPIFCAYECGTDSTCGGQGASCCTADVTSITCNTGAGFYCDLNPNYQFPDELVGLESMCTTCPTGSHRIGTAPYCACDDSSVAFDQYYGCNCGSTQNPCVSCPGGGTGCQCGPDATPTNGQCVCNSPTAVFSFPPGRASGICTGCGIGQVAQNNVCVCPAPFTTDPTSGDCFCPADTYFSGGKCLACPANSASTPPGQTDSCNCQSGYYPLPASSSPTGAAVCVSCPADSSLSSDPSSLIGACNCNDPSKYYDYMSNTCRACPSGSTSDGAGSCYCSSYLAIFDPNHGVCSCFDGSPCSCPAGDYLAVGVPENTCVTCPEGSTVASDLSTCNCEGVGTFYSPNSNTCVTCSGGAQSYFDGTKCGICPKGSTPSGTTCLCDGLFQYDGTVCTCEAPSLNYGEYLDGNGNCNLCPSYAPPDTVNYVGCVCTDPTLTFNSATGTCQTPSMRARARAKERRALQWSLHSQPETDWKFMPSYEVCPDQETPCPVLPSMSSFECLDTLRDIENCGGCGSTGQGINCLQSPGVISATCREGTCRSLSCAPGWEINEDRSGCRPSGH
ncbi:hypothetical protein T439DRAFT_324942 [Meredithblackwellia eburnea MCA 4105]